MRTLLLALALTLHPAAAHPRDTPPTCHGKLATIVGDDPSQGSKLTGTAGDDVIITNGAEYTDAGAGDDTICVTGRNRDEFISSVEIDAGSGSDVVDSTGSTERTVDFLGVLTDPPASSADVDTFVGGAVGDTVLDPGGETVHIDTGDGDDHVSSEGRDESADVELGGGDDTYRVTDRQAKGGTVSVDGGDGDNELFFESSTTRPRASTWVVDDKQGQATRQGLPVLTWRGFDDFALDLENDTTTFAGGPISERVTGTFVSASLGAGDDSVVISPVTRHLDGGPGRDRIEVEAIEAPYVHLNLEAGTLKVDPALPSQQLRNFEDARVDALGPAIVVGTDRSNRLTLHRYGCTSSIDGRGGNDTLTFGAGASCYHSAAQARVLDGGPGNDLLNGGRSGETLLGGPGDDILRGKGGADRLDGGPGRDYANGGAGSDRCTAEREYACER